jgi:membrane associated rhomboid family serine protease
MLWKGRQLEYRLGTQRFLTLLVFFGIASGVIHTALAYILMVTGWYPSSYYTGSLGFSGVLFSMKVLLTYMNPLEYSR